MIEVGSNGLCEINLIIPQSTSLIFEIIHKDDSGNLIDHSQSVMHMAFKSKSGTIFADASQYVTGLSDKIIVALPSIFSSNLPLGKLLWDLIVDMADGETVRLGYGTATIVDTYALDGE